ncbi:MAG: hydroxymethylglutaryl-CoA lyase [Acidobacteriota bacterium]|nr:hydroxymethylglutaryl-CoA lyase [Acidobacteriota bacterium]MDQ7087913.1 hydroxymethylglutaryl-CoA lyase [Acidobacteriota bacterium]
MSDQRRDDGKLPVRITEVGPRDGLQNERRLLDVDQRVELVERLADAGLREIEIGSFVHPRWVPQMSHTEAVAARVRRRPGVVYWGLIPNMRGLERAIRAGLTHVATVMSASETHNRKNINRTREQSLEEIRAIARRVAAEGLVLRTYVSTAFGCPFEGPVDFDQVLDLVRTLAELEVEGVSLGDTVGVGQPGQIREGCERALEVLGPEKLVLHLHDTQGLALANALVAVQAGVRRLDSSVGGTGGCPYAPGASGNVGTEDLVNLLEGLGFATGVDVGRLVETSRWLEQSAGVSLSSRYYRYALARSFYGKDSA